MCTFVKSVCLVLASAWLMATILRGQACNLERASTSYVGTEGSALSQSPSLSFDGRFVSFSSFSNNLVPGDSNNVDDVFVLDRLNGMMELVSLTSAGAQANGHCASRGLSGDGRMVVFGSVATNLDPRDTDSVPDIYVHDRLTKTTTLVSERLGSGPSVQGCYGASISEDGRFVAFDCIDDNVVPGDTNFSTDVFVRDLVTQTTELVSIGPLGQPGSYSLRPSISADGRFVAFMGAASNWFPVGPVYYGAIFVRDRMLGTTLAPTLLPSGYLHSSVCWDPTISADGRYVAYEGGGPRLTPGQPYAPFNFDILRWDRVTGQTLNVCSSVRHGPASYPSRAPVLSADGRFIAFETLSWNQTVQSLYVPAVLWKDLETGATVVANEDPQGGPANNWANDVAISGDGCVVAFVSKATNLVPGASGNVYHVYVRACDVASPATYCKPAKPPGGCVATMTFAGTPSATAGSGFQVLAQAVDAQQVGLLFYGTSGPWGTRPQPRGYLCVQPPLLRTPAGATGGTTGCDGSLAMDFNAWIASGVDPSLVAGQPVYVQGWFRNSAGQGQLSDAVAFLIEP